MSIVSSRTVAWPLRSGARKFAVLLMAGFISALLALEALRIASAATLAQSDRPGLLETALSLDPADANIHHRLGMLRYYSSLPGGLAHLQRATELNPDEALYWSDLASACESSGDATCADHAVARALVLSPKTPRISWLAANYYMRAGRLQRALELFRQLLDLDPTFAAPAFQVCLRTLGAPGLVDEQIVEPNRNPQVELAWVDFISARGDDESAYAAWGKFALDAHPADVTGLPATMLAVIPSYIDHLIDRGREREAVAVWADIERLQLVGAPGDDAPMPASQGNLVFNAGFESAPVNWGFDWRYSSLPFVALGLSSIAAHAGDRSLRIDFTIPSNQECEPVYQIVPVDPNRSYILSAFVRSESITSDTGPRLRVVDPFRPAGTSFDTEGTTATTAWHQVRLSFSTGPQTRFAKVSVWRPRSRSFPSEITGTFWLDDISLNAVNNREDAALRTSERASRVRLASLD